MRMTAGDDGPRWTVDCLALDTIHSRLGIASWAKLPGCGLPMWKPQPRCIEVTHARAPPGHPEHMSPARSRAQPSGGGGFLEYVVRPSHSAVERLVLPVVTPRMAREGRATGPFS